MKTKSIFAGLLLATAPLLSAAPDLPKMELRADSMTQSGSITIAKGSAVAVIGALQVSAEQISFDRETGILKYVGEATVRTPDKSFKAVDATIDTRDKNPSVRATQIRVER